MHYRKLGKTDLNVCEVSFGCMSLGEEHAANAALLHQAFEGGINFFDTADLYQKGFNETTLGKAFRGMRKQVIIATKVGNQWRSDGSGWDWNPTKDYILKAVDESLRRLQTDYIDLYQLHGGTIDDPIEETIEAFEILKKAGKIRHYGISSIRPNVIREWIGCSNMASVMMQYSLLDRRPEESCLALLEKHEIGVLARGSLAQGLLLGKPPKPYLGRSKEEVTTAAEAIMDISESSHPKAAVAVGYVLHAPAVSSAVLGIRTQEQLQEAIAVAAAEPLKKQELEQLRQSVTATHYEQHR